MIDALYVEMLAQMGGVIVRNNFRTALEVVWKDDGSPVTDTDLAIRDMLFRKVQHDFQGVQVITEEGSTAPCDGHEIIMCDPLDGTAAFRDGIQASCVCVSHLVDGIPQNACIYDPHASRSFRASRGGGAFLNGCRIKVSTQAVLERASIGVVWWPGCDFDMLSVMRALAVAGARPTMPYSIGLWGALVACGSYDALLAPTRSPWEAAALKVLVEEAGGIVTNLRGEDTDLYDGSGPIGGLLVSNRIALHRTLTQLLWDTWNIPDW